MTKLTISVTQEDIAAGVRLNCGLCPIARAVRRALRLAEIPYSEELIAITRKSIHSHGVGHRGKIYNLPDAAGEFISCFDSGFPVKPIIFEIELAK